MRRPKLGIFNLSSCEGCLVQILNLGDRLFDIIELFDIVDCRVLGIKKEYEDLDVALVEGCVMSEEEEEKLKEIRRKSRIVVALGDCAVSCNLNFMKDPNSMRGIYGKSLIQVIEADYFIPGCPINNEEFYEFMIDIYMRKKKPYSSSITVCSECILNENDCLLNKGLPCLGPITKGGCNALCPTNNRPCFGCRGLSDDANIEEMIRLLEDKKISVPEYLRQLLSKVKKVE